MSAGDLNLGGCRPSRGWALSAGSLVFPECRYLCWFGVCKVKWQCGRLALLSSWQVTHLWVNVMAGGFQSQEWNSWGSAGNRSGILHCFQAAHCHRTVTQYYERLLYFFFRLPELSTEGVTLYRSVGWGVKPVSLHYGVICPLASEINKENIIHHKDGSLCTPTCVCHFIFLPISSAHLSNYIILCLYLITIFRM